MDATVALACAFPSKGIYFSQARNVREHVARSGVYAPQEQIQARRGTGPPQTCGLSREAYYEESRVVIAVPGGILPYRSWIVG